MGTSGILLIAISPTSIFAFFNNFLQCIPKESVADSLSAYRIWYLEAPELQHTNFQQVKSEMLQDWGGGLDYGQDLA